MFLLWTATAATTAPSHVAVACIGGGVSGLLAGRSLARAGVGVTVLEGSDRPGGRVRSDRVEGFTLDRGFAVFLTAYPESRAAFEYEGLDLQPFCPGAIVAMGPGASNRYFLADPLRQLSATPETLAFPLASPLDKLRLVLAVLRLKLSSLDDIFTREAVSTQTLLSERWGLSDTIINSFFRPFFGGVFLAPLTDQASTLFEFVLRMFVEGDAALPAAGMGAAPEQLATGLIAAGGELRLGARAQALRLGDVSVGLPHAITLADGRQLTCDRLVLSCTSREARRLLDGALPAMRDGPGTEPKMKPDTESGTAPGTELAMEAAEMEAGIEASPLPSERPMLTSICLYFSLEGAPPISQPCLVLNGQAPTRLVNNMCFPSLTCAEYAPEGKHLASVTVVPSLLDAGGSRGAQRGVDGGAGSAGPAWLDDDAALEAAVRRELGEWFGREVEDWRLLRIYWIREAQEARPAGPWAREPRVAPARLGVYACGDYCATPSLNGALKSGRLAAEAVLRDARQ